MCFDIEWVKFGFIRYYMVYVNRNILSICKKIKYFQMDFVADDLFIALVKYEQNIEYQNSSSTREYMSHNYIHVA